MPKSKVTPSITSEMPKLESIIKRIPLFSKVPYQDISFKTLNGETNKNYLLSLKNEQYILRIPCRASDSFINRNDEATNSKIAEALSLAPKNIWRELDQNQKASGLSINHYLEHSRAAIVSDFKDSSFLIKLVESLSLLQNSKLPFKGLRNEIKTAQSLEEYFKLCTSEQKNILKKDYLKSLKLLKETNCQRPAIPSHVDLTLDNILIQNNRIWLIDWEYSAMSSPFWDIATLCNSGELDEQAANSLLKMVIKNSDVQDYKCLRNYQFITRTLSNCWLAALSTSALEEA